jgi:hypothetical protein
MLMTQLARANEWLNKTAIAVAISGGANLGEPSIPSTLIHA